jgi:hypothetical protein
MSPTQRTLVELRKRGFTAYVVERWNPYARVRQDLFGIIDILALKPGVPLLAVQATSSANVHARLAKVRDSSLASDWVSSGNHLEVWGWGKRGPRGKRKIWTVTIHSIHKGE